MKKQVKLLLIILVIGLTFSINANVKAAIAIKEAGNTVLTNKTISEFFDMAMQMKDAGQALEGTSLDPHMATNKEWAAVSYLSNSNYGTAGEGQNAGATVTINGNSHYSTTDNITGVIDWGKDYSFTAGVLSEANTKITDETIKTNGKSLLENTSKVDDIETNQNEIFGAFNWYPDTAYAAVIWRTDYAYPYSARKGLFGMIVGAQNSPGIWWSGYQYYFSTGNAKEVITFRPVL